VVHDGSDEVVAGFPDSLARPADDAVSGKGSGSGELIQGGVYGADRLSAAMTGYRDSETSAARFFYTAKADGDERIGSKHPTVKPIDLMQWLVRLVTPKGGSVLDPFAGTGTTGEAAWREGCRATLIEREAEYLADIARRMELMKAGPDERAREIVKASGKVQGHEDLPLFNRQWESMWAKPFDKPELVWGKK
jgi:site-specific DNA-methyltransferase (adenine-specific)